MGAAGSQRLRAERERRGLERQQVADDLHVDVWIIEALEAGRFESLGAPVYARGHLRKYAELLGLDAGQILADSAQETVRPPELVPVVQAREPHREVPVNIVGGLVVGVVIAGTAWWALSGRDAETQVAPNPIVAEPSETATVSESAAPPLAPGMAQIPVAAPEAATPTVAAPLQDEKVSAPVPAPAAAGTEVRLRLSFSADSWVELYDASGRRVYFDIGPANSVRSFTAAAPVRVFLGNADGVQLEMNGQAIAVPERVRRGNVARFTLDERGQVNRAEG
jgi:cytoskeleton protein RodZ